VICAAAVLALAGCDQQHPQRETPAKPKPAYTGLAELPEHLEADGTTITVGDPKASVTVRLYEDPRCPVCEKFETTGGGPALQEANLRREAKTEYTLASFLDDGLGGAGSKKAVNALRAALEEGKFAEYHAVLYANQPEESNDGFTDDFLLELATKVDGLRGPTFDKAVRSMKYRDFVATSETAYELAHVPGTPTVDINNVRIPSESNAVLFDRAAFARLLREIHEAPWQWDGTQF